MSKKEQIREAIIEELGEYLNGIGFFSYNDGFELMIDSLWDFRLEPTIRIYGQEAFFYPIAGLRSKKVDLYCLNHGINPKGCQYFYRRVVNNVFRDYEPVEIRANPERAYNELLDEVQKRIYPYFRRKASIDLILQEDLTEIKRRESVYIRSYCLLLAAFGRDEECQDFLVNVRAENIHLIKSGHEDSDYLKKVNDIVGEIQEELFSEIRSGD